MQITAQAPAAPTAPTAPTAPGAAAVQTSNGRTVTVVGSDGKTVTIRTDNPVVAGTEVAPFPVVQPTEDYFAQGAAMGVTMTLLTLGVFALYNRWKRRGMKRDNPEIPGESAARLERVERGMEAIAIEIERISEGQRFVTKMLADTRAPAISEKR